MALPSPITNDVLLNRFKAGLPQKLQDQAVLVTGDFDTVISSVSRLSTAQKSSSREPVREIGEGSGYSNRKPPASDSTDNRFAHVKCHYCQKLGHIARFCSKKLADKAKEEGGETAAEGGAGQGEANGGENPPRKN